MLNKTKYTYTQRKRGGEWERRRKKRVLLIAHVFCDICNCFSTLRKHYLHYKKEKQVFSIILSRNVACIWKYRIYRKMFKYRLASWYSGFFFFFFKSELNTGASSNQVKCLYIVAKSSNSNEAQTLHFINC